MEIDFRINVFSRNIEKKFIILDKNLTVYRNVHGGIMDNIKKFSYITKIFKIMSYISYYNVCFYIYFNLKI